MRLRGEAGLQKNELEKLRTELALGPHSPRSRAARERAAKNYYPKERWAAAGFASPEATVQSLSWAASQGDYKAVLACMAPDAQAQVAKQLEGKSDGEITGELASESSHMNSVDGLRIVNWKTVSDDEVILTVYNQGGDSWGSVPLKRFGNEWKVSGGGLNTP
jgi:hypothetical protein